MAISYIVPDFVYDNIDSIKTIRKTLKISLGELSKETGISLLWISRIEDGDQLPSRAAYNKLAKVFDWEVWN